MVRMVCSKIPGQWTIIVLSHEKALLRGLLHSVSGEIKLFKPDQDSRKIFSIQKGLPKVASNHTRNFDVHDPYDPYYPYFHLDQHSSIGKDGRDGKGGVV